MPTIWSVFAWLCRRVCFLAQREGGNGHKLKIKKLSKNLWHYKWSVCVCGGVWGAGGRCYKSVKYDYLDGSSCQQHDLPPLSLWTTDVMTKFVLTAFFICVNVMFAPEMQINQAIIGYIKLLSASLNESFRKSSSLFHFFTLSLRTVSTIYRRPFTFFTRARTRWESSSQLPNLKEMRRSDIACR